MPQHHQVTGSRCLQIPPTAPEPTPSGGVLPANSRWFRRGTRRVTRELLSPRRKASNATCFCAALAPGRRSTPPLRCSCLRLRQHWPLNGGLRPRRLAPHQGGLGCAQLLPPAGLAGLARRGSLYVKSPPVASLTRGLQRNTSALVCSSSGGKAHPFIIHHTPTGAAKATAPRGKTSRGRCQHQGPTKPRTSTHPA